VRLADLRNRAPAAVPELIWADPAHLPPDTVDYTATAISAIEEGKHFLVNGWETSLPATSVTSPICT
jgi:hypothetical protein